jgi:hypothetical protein
MAKPLGRLEDLGCDDPPVSRAPAGPQASASADISRLIDALFDTAALQNPEAFAIVSKPTRTLVTPGAAANQAVQFFLNKLPTPVLLFMEVAPTVTLLPGALIVGRENGKATLADAIRVEYSTAPKVSLVIPPNGEVFVDITHPDGLATALQVQFTVLPLRGRSSVFTQGGT